MLIFNYLINEKISPKFSLALEIGFSLGDIRLFEVKWTVISRIPELS